MNSSSDSIGIDNIQGDVIASKVEGMGTIAGKDVHVTIEGNVFNIGNALKDNIKEILESSSTVPKDDHTHIENSQRIQQAKASEKNIQEIMHILKRIEEKEGISPTKIKAGEYDISTDSLLEKKYVLEGNKYFFKREYDKALECYDKAIDIEPYDSDVWYNKGCALEGIKKYDEAIRCYDNAIDIEPHYSNAWYAKGNLLYQKTAKQKIIISMALSVFISLGIFGISLLYENYDEALIPQTIALIVIPLFFLYFWYKEGIILFRRLNTKIKRRIFIIGIAIIVVLWISFFYFEFNLNYLGIQLSSVRELNSSTYLLGEQIHYKTLDSITDFLQYINIPLTITFFLFVYNTLSRGEYYLNKAKELGKSNL